jgi:hypothetical protein
VRHKRVWPMSETERVDTFDGLLDLLSRKGGSS